MKTHKKGFAAFASVLAISVLLLIGSGIFTILASNVSMIKSSGEALQAQYFAQLEADMLKLVPYDELDNIDNNWQTFSNDENWQYKVKIGPEQNIDNTDAKMKIASIYVQKTGDMLERFSLQVPLSSQGSNTLPVGSILWWYSHNIPDGYLLCNGQSTSSYPRLAETVGANVPNLLGKFIYAAGDDEVLGTVTQSSSFTMTFDGKFPHIRIGANDPDDGHLSGYLATPVAGADGHAVNAIVIGNRTFYGQYKPMHIACYPIIKAQ